LAHDTASVGSILRERSCRHLAQAIGQAAIQQGYRETHKLLDDLAEATINRTRKQHMELLATVPLFIIDDLGMRKLPVTAAADVLKLRALTSAFALP